MFDSTVPTFGRSYNEEELLSDRLVQMTKKSTDIRGRIDSGEFSKSSVKLNMRGRFDRLGVNIIEGDRLLARENIDTVSV